MATKAKCRSGFEFTKDTPYLTPMKLCYNCIISGSFLMLFNQYHTKTITVADYAQPCHKNTYSFMIGIWLISRTKSSSGASLQYEHHFSMDQTLNSHETPHIFPSEVSYGAHFSIRENCPYCNDSQTNNDCFIVSGYVDGQGPFYKYRLTLILDWISNHMRSQWFWWYFLCIKWSISFWNIKCFQILWKIYNSFA